MQFLGSFVWLLSTLALTGTATAEEIRSGAGKCLDVQSYCQGENGCNVQVWDCSGSRQQSWFVGGDEIVGGVGQCLDVHSNCQGDNGCNVQVWKCNGSPQQTWSASGGETARSLASG